MGELTVPVIDLGDAPAAVARAVDDAARTVGFMQILGHGIPQSVLDAFTTALDEFFALDPETKNAYRCPPELNRGYTAPRSEALANSLGLATAADLFEAFNVGVPEPSIYPSEIPEFEAAVSAYFAEAGRVARALVRVFGVALGLGAEYLTQFTDHSLEVLRLNNYRLPSPEVELEPDQLGMGAHTDFGIVTVLWADPVPGLEILTADGAWQPVVPEPGALLVNLGDALARWTNDQWLSTMHRVAPPRIDGELVPRRSAAFFHDGNVDAVIAPLPGCVDAEHPARYAPISVGEHIAAKLAGSRGGYLNPNAAREAARLNATG